MNPPWLQRVYGPGSRHCRRSWDRSFKSELESTHWPPRADRRRLPKSFSLEVVEVIVVDSAFF
eukprot:1187081-Prorocentrum_minimum.AAC.8